MGIANRGIFKRVAAVILTVVVGFYTIGMDNVLADTYYKDSVEVVYNQTIHNFRNSFSDTQISKVNAASEGYVEVVIKMGTGIVARKAFDKTASEWKMDIPTVGGKNYTANIYMIDAIDAQADAENEAPLCYATFSVGKVEGNLAATSSVSGTSQSVKVSLTNLSSSYLVSGVRFHFVNEAGKDVYNAMANRDSATKYTLSVNATKLKPSYGEYTVKAEVIDANGVNVTLSNTATTTLVAAYTKLTISKASNKTGTFQVATGKIYAIGKISSVSVKVWCQGENEDAHVYKCKANKSKTYKCTVDAENHKYHSGTYNVEVLVKLKNGKTYSAATGTCKLDLTNFVKYGETSKKSFCKKISIYNPTVTKNVYLSVASKKSKGEDKKYYEGTYKNGHLSFTVKMKDLKYAGTINVQLCKKSGKKYSVIKKYTYTATDGEIQKCGWYYEKAKNGKTYKFYYSKGKKLTNLTKVLKLKKAVPMHIEVNRQENRVTVYAYDEDTKSWCIPVIAFKCSVGVSSMPTPKGTYRTDRKHRWKELMGPSWGQYATHVVKGIYFHSIAGSTTNSYGVPSRQYNKLGIPASHGCIRLTVRDAKWIYDYCALKTEVKIYDSAFAGPIGAQYVPKIPAGQNYDPTDPAVKKKK